MESKDLSLDEYTERVYYCRSCHSLHILVDDAATDDWDGSYCAKCGSTDVGECMFGDWLAEEESRKEKELEREWNR